MVQVSAHRCLGKLLPPGGLDAFLIKIVGDCAVAITSVSFGFYDVRDNSREGINLLCFDPFHDFGVVCSKFNSSFLGLGKG